ncbi:MAG TPA: hypothetical protein VJL81_02945 [Solirubrobacterales bacterium]|nr:hypothetical protein [Solirubrobacterales bacterium]
MIVRAAAWGRAFAGPPDHDPVVHRLEGDVIARPDPDLLARFLYGLTVWCRRG